MTGWEVGTSGWRIEEAHLGLVFFFFLSFLFLIYYFFKNLGIVLARGKKLAVINTEAPSYSRLKWV